MPKGIYAAASAMLVESRNQESIARNLANVETSGYRRETAIRSSFAEALAHKGRTGNFAGDGGAGVLDDGAVHSFEEGTKENTGAPLDLALSGNGFYRVTDQHGRTFLTRTSHFTTDAQGRIVTAQGFTLNGQGGAITIPTDATRVQVSKNGTVSVQSTTTGQTVNTVIDQLRIVKVAHPGKMHAMNGEYFDPGDQATSDSTSAVVQQGFVEHSNVEPMQQLAMMIAGQRRYDAAQRTLRELDKAGTSLTDLLRGST